MAVVTHEDVQAVPAVDEMATEAAEVSEQSQGERIAKLEGRFEEASVWLHTLT